MTVLNFLRESGCTFACAVDKGPVDFLDSVIPKGVDICGGKRTASMLSQRQARYAKQERRSPSSRIRQSTRQQAKLQLRLRGGRTDQDDKMTTGARAEDRDQHHGPNRSTARSRRVLAAESVQSQARRLFAHTAPSKEGHTEETWSNLLSSSTTKCQA